LVSFLPLSLLPMRSVYVKGNAFASPLDFKLRHRVSEPHFFFPRKG